MGDDLESRTVNRQRVLETAERGAKSIAALARELQYLVEDIKPVLEDHEITHKTLKINLIRTYWNKGVRKEIDMAKKTGLSPPVARKYAEMDGKTFTGPKLDFMFQEKVKAIDDIVKSGQYKSERAIAKMKELKEEVKEDWSREKVRQYLIWSGQDEQMKQNRKNNCYDIRHKLELRRAEEQRVKDLEEKKKLGWAEKQAATYLIKYPAHKISFEKLVNLFEIYKENRKSRCRPSLEVIGDQALMSAVTVGMIFYRLNLKPFHTRRNTGKEVKYQK